MRLDGSRGGDPRRPAALPLGGPMPFGGGWKGRGMKRVAVNGAVVVAAAATELWDRLFRDGYRADVCIRTSDGVIPAHAIVLREASPVMKSMLRKWCREKKKAGTRRRAISIHGVPHGAVRAFIRFLYSSCYQQEDMDTYVLQLLVLSHVFVVPRLKRECVQQLAAGVNGGLLSVDNVVDALQLAGLCDAPRLSLFCNRFILRNLEAVSATDGWEAMRRSNPKMANDILEEACEANARMQKRAKKLEERKIYLQLYRVMEALVHICRDGCRNVGPRDRVLTAANQPSAPCKFQACVGLELLLRHFPGCHARSSGSCRHCRKMGQLFELHARLCTQPDDCKVPLCRKFKEKTLQHQNKRDEMKWKLLVDKVKQASNFTVSNVNI